MRRRRLKLIWGASGVIRGRWILGTVGFYTRAHGAIEDGIAISLRGVLVALGCMGLFLYAAGATTLFIIWQKNPYSLLTWTDALLYPARRSEVSEKKGRAFIAQGQDLLREQKWSDGIYHLRLGLAQCPRDLRARLTLARFYELTQQRALALSTLAEGLGPDYPGNAYLTSVLTTAEAGDDHDFIVRAVARYTSSPRADVPTSELRWLLTRQFNALMNLSRGTEALALTENRPNDALAQEQRVLALLELKRPHDALAHLAAWRAQSGADLVVVTRLAARAYREAQDFAGMESALAEMRALSPADPSPRVYAIVQQTLAGRPAAASAALDDYLFRFGGFADNLLLAARPLAKIGEVALLVRLTEAARERGHFLGIFHALLIQAHLSRGEWPEASGILAAIQPAPHAPDEAANRNWKEWMRHLLAVLDAPNPAATSALLQLFRDQGWSAAVFATSIDALHRGDRLEPAAEVAAIARAAFPESRRIQSLDAAVRDAIAVRNAASEAAPPPKPS